MKPQSEHGYCSTCGRRYTLHGKFKNIRAHPATQPELRIGGPKYCSGSGIAPATSLEIAQHIYFYRNWEAGQ